MSLYLEAIALLLIGTNLMWMGFVFLLVKRLKLPTLVIPPAHVTMKPIPPVPVQRVVINRPEVTKPVVAKARKTATDNEPLDYNPADLLDMTDTTVNAKDVLQSMMNPANK